MKYKAIKDTREKNGWDFEVFESCRAMEISCLKTGDYTIEGYEHILCIERKASTAEVANNLGVNKKRFDAEMERISKYPQPFLILEFSMSDLLDFPRNSGIPVKKWSSIKITGKYLLKTLLEYQVLYNVKILFCDDKDQAEEVCDSIFKRIMRLEK